jgi:uncharacterized coiled-coil protein SlyX
MTSIDDILKSRRSKIPLIVQMPTAKSFEERLVALELLATHLERDFEALNSALLEQQKAIAELSRLLARLEARMTRLLEDDEEPRDPSVERPPHY